MMTETFDIIDKLVGNIVFKFGCQLIDRAGEHEVLPDYQTQLIAEVIKFIVRIVPSAPYTDTVEIGQFGVLQEPAALLGADPSKKVLLGNVVSSHGKVLYSVYHMSEGFSPLVFFHRHSHGAQADPAAPAVNDLSFVKKIYSNLV